MDNVVGQIFENIFSYNLINKQYLNHDAVFADESLNFVSNNEPKVGEKITIMIRVAIKDEVNLFVVVNKDKKLELVHERTDGFFDYFGASFNIENDINYYFIIVKNGKTYYYNKNGLHDVLNEGYNLRIIVDFKTPLWAKGATMYQLYVDRFYNGDKTNDVLTNEYTYLGRVAKKMPSWETPVENDDIANFYGGDLQGVIDKMEYLKDLGIDAIYFNPIFVSPSNHKYDTQDYDYIDPHYGVIINDGGEVLSQDKLDNKYATMYIKRTTDKENLEASNNLMKKLIGIAHDNGIKVILDGVFNHCGAFNKWLDKGGFYDQENYPKGAYGTEKSPYNSYFKWNDKNGWPNNNSYDSWWNHDNHPKLNFENSKELYEYIISIGVKWVSPPYNADGWRLDVAADLGYSKEFNHKFWIDFRKAVKKANPEAIILAEHYGDPSDWLKGDQWDTIMNYDAFMEPVTWFLTGMEKHSESYRSDMLCNSSAFEESIKYHASKLPFNSLQVSMNQLSNHDHSRFLTRTNKTVGRLHTVGRELASENVSMATMYLAVVFQMTWQGAPTIYYGDEAGLTGWTDPDNRRTYPWGKENKTLMDLHKELIQIRKNSETLKIGSTVFLQNEFGVISFGRWFGEKIYIIIINNSDTIRKMYIPVWKANVMPDYKLIKVMSTGEYGFNAESAEYLVRDGVCYVEIKPKHSLVLKS